MYLEGEISLVVHAVGANVLLNVGVFVVVDPKTDVAGGL
jgi:hypothetical protein